MWRHKMEKTEWPSSTTVKIKHKFIALLQAMAVAGLLAMAMPGIGM